jgi:TonB family protein
MLSTLACLFASTVAGAAPDQVLVPPKLSRFIEAEYPPSALAARTSTSVLISIQIGADGRVEAASIARPGGPEFDRAALEAVRRFVFEPASLDGKPVAVKILYRYDFRLEEERTKLGPQINFEGVVRERFKKKPIGGVQIRVKDVGTSTVTGDDGRFRFFDLPIGTHAIEVSGPTLITVSTEETISERTKTSVTYLVEEKEEGIDEEEIVRAPRIRRESSEIAIPTEEARLVPGTQGDTLKVVQNLPGVGRSAIGSGQIVVWGSAPKDTHVFVDGVEIPALYHLGGLRSTVNSDLVKTIDLVPGAYGADYGRGLGGLVRVETRALPQEGLHGYVGADAIDASALLSAAPLANLRIGAAARFSYLDRILSGVVAPDIGDIFPIPRYRDYQLKSTLDLRSDESLTLLFLGSNDRLKRTIDSNDPTQVRFQNVDVDFYRGALTYARILPSGASFTVTPNLGFDRSDEVSAFGAVPAELRVSSLRYGVRASYRERIEEHVLLAVGADVAGTRARVHRTGSITLPPREGDIFVFGQPPGDDVNADDFVAEIAGIAPYAFLEITLGRLLLTPGFRLDGWVIDGERALPRVGATPQVGFSRLDTGADPRLALKYRLTDDITLQAAGGLYHQAPQPEELSAVFGTPTLGISRAIHGTAGARIALSTALSLEVVGFYKALEDLVTRSRAPTPSLANALTQLGTGRSYGGQVLLRQELAAGFFGWVSYALTRSERQDAPDAPVRLFDYDQTHVLSLVASWAYEDWVFGARVRYATGFPRTPVTGAFFDARDDAYQPIFGAQNSIRIPAFFQADLRIERSFALDFGVVRFYLDAQNVTFRKNPEEIVYDYSFTNRSYITGLPFLASLGARLEF